MGGAHHKEEEEEKELQTEVNLHIFTQL